MSRAQLSHVTDWIFDLDNTLYPRDYDLFTQIGALITQYVIDTTGLPREEARVLQRSYYETKGTTLNGLMVDYGVDPDHYLKTVHSIDYSCVLAHPELVAAIAALPGRKFVFTNADNDHASQVLGRIGGMTLFDGMFDIRASNYVPKPARQAYDMFVKKFAIDPKRAVMFDDLEKNLLVPHELGMTTVHIVPQENYVNREIDAWEFSRADEHPHVHHVTDDLVGFLLAD